MVDTEASTSVRGPSGVLVVAALLCANPIVMMIVGWPALYSVGLSVLAIVFFQLLWRFLGTSLVTIYAINFVAVGGVWLHAEALVRARFHDFVMEDLYEQHGDYYFNRPNLKSRLHDKEYDVEYLTNRDGYRIGSSQDPARIHGQVDWLFLGDSYTQGAQVSFEELYTTKLYREFPDRVVVNAGVSGWGLYESLAFLKARGVHLRPSVVFVQIANFNDFMKVSPRRAGLSDYLIQSSESLRLLLQDVKYQNPTNLPLGRWVEPFYGTDDENRRFNVFYAESSGEKQRDLEQVGVVIRKLEAECRRIGAKLVLIEIPTKEQVSFTYLEEVVSGLNIDARLLDMERPNQLVRAIADSLGVALIDPLEQWRAASVFPFYHYDEHLNSEGHAMLARAVGLYVQQSEGGTSVRMLSRSYGGDRYPQFVPSGDSIVFHSPRDGNSELLQADIESWTERSLTRDDASETHPVLLPSGQGLVFVVGDSEGGATRLWRSDREGRRGVALDTSEKVFGATPAVFPDGESVVFPRWGPSPGAAQIHLTRLFLRDGRREDLPVVAEKAWKPAVDPTGRFVVYIGQVDGQYDLFELDLAAGSTKSLTRTPYDEWDPSYTPDGMSIVYAARAVGSWDLFQIARVSGATRQLTLTKGDEWDPQVAPDGNSIAFGGEYGLMRGIYLLPFAR